MYPALIILILFVCVLLALVVLAQNPKGGGLSNQFGSGGAANLMGVKRTGDLLERLTWGFAIALMVLALGTHTIGQTASGPARSASQQKALETRTVTPPAAPAAPGAAAPAAPGGASTAPAPATPAPQPATTPAAPAQ